MQHKLCAFLPLHLADPLGVPSTVMMGVEGEDERGRMGQDLM